MSGAHALGKTSSSTIESRLQSSTVADDRKTMFSTGVRPKLEFVTDPSMLDMVRISGPSLAGQNPSEALRNSNTPKYRNCFEKRKENEWLQK